MHITILDTHLHLYPCFELSEAFQKFLNNTSSYTEARRIACLAERHDCSYFSDIANGTTTVQGFELGNVDNNEIELIRSADQSILTLLAGRQIISREKIEILALGCPEIISDGQPALDVIYQILKLGHVPVLPWSPGKWFGERGKLIKSLIEQFRGGDFLIGDTTLRPYGWGTPGLMKQASGLGYQIVAGSDPLPFSGEESWLGAFHTIVKSSQSYGANELLHALKNGADDIELENRGRRTQPLNLFNRLRKNAAIKKAST